MGERHGNGMVEGELWRKEGDEKKKREMRYRIVMLKYQNDYRYINVI